MYAIMLPMNVNHQDPEYLGYLAGLQGQSRSPSHDPYLKPLIVNPLYRASQVALWIQGWDAGERERASACGLSSGVYDADLEALDLHEGEEYCDCGGLCAFQGRVQERSILICMQCGDERAV